MSNLKLRKATESDSEFVYQTKKAAFREFVEQIWGWDEKDQRQIHERQFESQDFSVIQWEGLDVGILAIVQESECIQLNQLYILPKYQDHGIGAACMKMIIENGDSLALPMQLQVLKINKRAFALFQKFGFKRVGESDTHILMERRS